MTERKILSSIRINLIIVAMAALAATNLFFNYLNPKLESTDLNGYLSYGMLSAMFAGFASLLLFCSELICYTRNKQVPKFFTLLKFMATIGSLVCMIYCWGYKFVIDRDLDQVLLYNGPLFTKTLIPLLSLYSLLYTESYHRHKLVAFVLGGFLPGAYGVYHIVGQLFFDFKPIYEHFDFLNEATRTTTIIATSAAGIGCLVLSLLVFLWMRVTYQGKKEKNRVVKIKENLNFATIENNQTAPFEFGEGKRPEDEDSLAFAKSSLTDILANNKLDDSKEESPELNKEIKFSFDDNEKVDKSLAPTEKLNLSLDQKPAVKAEEKKEEIKNVTPTPIKPEPKPTPEKKVEPDFKAEKQVKNENPLSVKVHSSSPKKAAPAPAKKAAPAPTKKEAPITAKKTAPAPAKKEENKETAHRVYHVGKQKSGKWQVKLENGEKAIKLFDTQKEAIDFAKDLIKTQGGSYRIHSRNGTIRKE